MSLVVCYILSGEGGVTSASHNLCGRAWRGPLPAPGTDTLHIPSAPRPPGDGPGIMNCISTDQLLLYSGCRQSCQLLNIRPQNLKEDNYKCEWPEKSASELDQNFFNKS
jgi:hypothetical protein